MFISILRLAIIPSCMSAKYGLTSMIRKPGLTRADTEYPGLNEPI